MKNLKLKELFLENKTLIVCEVAQAHDGSLGMAHAFIDAIADSGAGAVKFQTHIAAAESTPDEPWRIKFSRQDKTRYDYWQRMEFTEEQWHGLKQHADERSLLFLSSPFSIEAVELLERVGVAAWKIASGEVTNVPMFERMAETGLPFLLSTGMSTLSEIDDAVQLIQSKNLPIAILQCTSMYPTPAEKIGLNIIPFFKERYRCPVGLSDHSGHIYPGLGAIALGATLLEVHVAFSRQTFGPDVPASLTIEELQQLVKGTAMIEVTLKHPIDKDDMALEMAEMRRLFTKSIVAKYDLSAGMLLAEADLTVKKPGTGIPAAHLSHIVGRVLKCDIKKDMMLHKEDLL